VISQRFDCGRLGGPRLAGASQENPNTLAHASLPPRAFPSPRLPPGKRTKCSTLDGPSCILIGDAAHSVTPVFGQARARARALSLLAPVGRLARWRAQEPRTAGAPAGVRTPSHLKGTLRAHTQQTRDRTGTRTRATTNHATRALPNPRARPSTQPPTQGANSALESCLVLDGVLASAAGDTASVPAAFTAARLEDAHALQEVDRLAYSFFRRRGIFDADFLALLAHVLVGTILSKLVPFLYGARPALLQLGAGLPYSKILRAVRRDAAAAAVGLAALGVWAGSKLAARLAAGGA
jgi:hypothetical protein